MSCLDVYPRNKVNHCMNWKTFLLIVSLFGFCLSVHAHNTQYQSYNQKAELDLLKKQQGKFEKMVEDISGDLESLTKKLGDAGSDEEKVLLLESSIAQQRRQIFNMSVSILPQFNFSRCACENLTEEQKVGLLKNLEAVKGEISRLQRILQKFPKSQRANQLREDVEKQLFFVNSMREIILAKCLRTIIISPTIFQTNLYAPNWILGNQTASQVVDEYYQRSIRYDNVTNCPIDRPFFNGQICTTCSPPRPVFDLLDRKCVSCGDGYSPNNITKKCDLIPIPVYASNYNDTNYSLDGLSQIPPRPADAIADCPLVSPFFDGKKCIPCKYPTYFSIPNSVCKNCPVEHAYDINTKNCEKVVKNYLTRLESQWVTRLDNYINIYHEREAILRRNSSLGNYHDCEADRPFYDNIACIACPQPKIYFNYDTNRCVLLPQGMTYDANIHAFVMPLQNYQSMVGATYILAFANITDDSSLSKCTLPKPYFDGLTCIKCYPPNNLFDVEAKHCAKCSHPELYDKIQLKCVVCSEEQSYNTRLESCEYHSLMLGNYEAGSYVNLTEPLDVLIDRNSKKMSANPNAKTCPIEAPYYTGQRCINCHQDLPLFNHTSQTCTKCLQKQAYNPTLHLCETFFELVQLTNINAGNIIDLVGSIDSINDEQQKIMSRNPKATICPIDTPYATKQGCISCKDQGAPLFSYSKKICTACKDNWIYNTKLNKCDEIRYLTNLNSGNLIDLGDTLASLRRIMDMKIEENSGYRLCGEATPFYDGKNCIACNPPVPLFSFTKKICTSCKDNWIYDSKQNKCNQIRYLTNLNAKNLVDLGESIESLRRVMESKLEQNSGYRLCEEATPYYDGRNCITCSPPEPLFSFKHRACAACPRNTWYNKREWKCQRTRPMEFLTDLKTKNIILNDTMSNLIRYQEEIQAKNPQAKTCPSDKPFSIGPECISCPDLEPLFDYASSTCSPCTSGTIYSPQLMNCEKYSVPIPSLALKWSKALVDSDSDRTRYLTNLEASKGNLVNLPKDIKAVKLQYERVKDQKKNVEICPAETPYSTGKSCISCKGSENLWNLTSHKCSKCEDYEVYKASSFQCEGKDGEEAIKKKSGSSRETEAPRVKASPEESTRSQREHLVSNVKVSNWIVSVRSPSQIYEKIKNYLKSHPEADMCPSSKPFLRGGYCISCPEDEYYDFDSRECTRCPSEREFDVNTHRCLKRLDAGAYQTNPTTAPNLILGGISLAQYESTYKDNQEKYSRMRDCPEERPYFNKINCIKCAQPLPYFNMQTSLCQKCGKGSSYNKDTKECEDSQGKVVSQNPTIQKILASIF